MYAVPCALLFFAGSAFAFRAGQQHSNYLLIPAACMFIAGICFLLALRR